MDYRLLAATLALTPAVASAQYNVDRLITSGEVALHYEDYVLSIQYFSKALALKPYLWQPWYDRAAAKLRLEDFVGAEQDATEAIRLNPYIEDIFDLRAIARLRQEKYSDAITDYDRAIRLKPTEKGYWINRAIARMNLKDYDHAMLDADTIMQRWRGTPAAYQIKAQACLEKADTAQADHWLARTLEVDPYNSGVWTTRAYIALNRRRWATADTCLTQAIRLVPRGQANNYVNRALARINLNKLRGAMEDYDMAIDIDPKNFLAHYNRGLLRVQLGDDNRAITDFDFVIQMEPQNFMAIFNRALLNEKVGNLRAAIRDYSMVIDQFPNFWNGLAARARCYRRLGQTAKAEMDEFRIFKAQMDKHVGIQQRWSRAKLKAMRKRSEVDPNKFNDIVVEDRQEYKPEYKSEYRGQVQNRDVRIAPLPMFALTYFTHPGPLSSGEAYDQSVERFNRTAEPLRPLHLACDHDGAKLTDTQSRQVFQLIDALSAGLSEERENKARLPLLLQRAVAYAEAQNYADAIADLDEHISIDGASAMARWMRAVCQVRLNDYDSSRGQNTRMMAAQAEGDFAEALKLEPRNAYIYYDRALLYQAEGNRDRAIADYTRALQLDPRLAEAYYNRGLARIAVGQREEGLADLSRAGELGLYGAYSIIKQENSDTKAATKKK